MASFYSSEGDMIPTAYMLNQKFPSYSSSQLDSSKEYTTHPSIPFPHINILSASSMSESIGSRDEMVFMPPTSIQAGMQQIERRSDITPHFQDGNKVITDTHMYPKESLHCSGSEPIPQYHGLSLSLGSQEPSLVQIHSDLNQYTSSSFCSMLNSEIQMSQNNDLKNVQYLSFDLGGQTQDAPQSSLHNMFTSKGSTFIPSVHQEPDVARTFYSSKYLKAAQDLLTEVVSVHRPPKPSDNAHNFNDATEMKRDVASTDLQESNNELSPTERNELQNKIMKLMDMLDEVDRRYKQYCHQMQAVVSSFDMTAGRDSSQPYTALASKTISRQFGTLRNAIKKQIQVIQKSFGEPDGNPHGLGVLSRLRYVDQQLRQQKAIQHFGIMRQPWRPQRGLPENAVSVLRAWLFEHFLNPYPKDSEKLVLARQTGLTRSQVANWFINARVRLWKPMIEEMYKDEFGDTETEFKSSPENATTAQDIPTFDDREQEFQGSLMSADANRQGQSNESMLDFISSSQIDESTYDNGGIQGNGVNFGLSMPNKPMTEVGGNDIFSDNNNHIASSNKAASENVVRRYDMMADSATVNQVSLALGLQHNEEKDSESMVHVIQHKETDISSSSEVVDKLDYYYTDPVNNQHRFANTHLLSDFVA